MCDELTTNSHPFLSTPSVAFCRRVSVRYIVALTAVFGLFFPIMTGSCELPAFPGARGFGAASVGGSGRHVTPLRSSIIRVTSLEDSGPGTLRECVSTKVPRICVFEVSGEIRLASILRVREPYLTIAGQTAPAPGIAVTRAGLSLESHDIVVQHIAVRVGDDPGGADPSERDGISIGGKSPKGVFNVILDHLSLTWALDENLSTYGTQTHDITVSNSIIAEGLDRSIHPKGPHSKGLMVGDGTRRFTSFRNLIAHNIERNPYLKPGSIVEFINNVVYGWGPKGGWSLCNVSDNGDSGEGVLLSFVGNVYKPGPNSVHLPPVYGKKMSAATRVFVSDNIGPGITAGAGNEWSIASLPESPFRTQTIPFAKSGIEAIPANEVIGKVLATVGSRPRDRSAPDMRIVSEVKNGGGGIKDCIAGCSNSVGGWPEFPRNSRPLVVPENSIHDGAGYTEVEKWLHDLAVEVEAPPSGHGSIASR